MSPRLAFAIQAAYEAGRSTLAHFQNATFELKADASPVTAADLKAERILREAIERVYPGDAILGEEEGGEPQADQWLIDPIDGTKSFICGVPLYATLLSFERSGETEVGVAYFPALDLMVAAERGSGATANGRPIRVSQTTELARATICCGGHRSLRTNGRMPGLMRLAEGALATRTWCDAYGHCLVAMGRVEGMVDPVVAAWDLSAVDLIVREAGGKCTDFEGGPNPRRAAVSSNGILHELLLESFRS